MRAFAGSRRQEPPETLMFSTNSATGVRALLKMASAFSAATKARSWRRAESPRRWGMLCRRVAIPRHSGPD